MHQSSIRTTSTIVSKDWAHLNRDDILQNLHQPHQNRPVNQVINDIQVDNIDDNNIPAQRAHPYNLRQANPLQIVQLPTFIDSKDEKYDLADPSLTPDAAMFLFDDGKLS
jgi:hypothetical protein